MDKAKKKEVVRADEWFSKYIRARDRKCVQCGSIFLLECGHLFTRARSGTRWDERAAFCQCQFCNRQHEWDADPFNNWFVEKYGPGEFERLQKQSFSIYKFTTYEIHDIGTYFKDKYNEIIKEKVS